MSVVSPFPPPTYSMAVGKQSTDDDNAEKLDYSELDEYWNNSVEHTSATI